MIKEDIIDILEAVIDDEKYSNIEINYKFNHNKYTREQKNFIKNIVSVVLKNLIYLDYILDKFTKHISKRRIRHLLRLSLAQIIFTKADNKGVVYEANEIAKNIDEYQAKFVNSTLKKIIVKMPELNKEIEDNKLWDKKYSYPKDIFQKIKIDYEQEYLEILKALKKRTYLSIRLNQDLVNVDEFCLANKDEILFRVDSVIYLKSNKCLEKLQENEYFIQDAASYLVAKNVNAKKEDVVLDACSSPGGKALCIMNIQKPKELIATDIYEHKIDLLNSVKEKYGFENMQVELKDATKANNFEKEMFDKILLDVPCSGLGVLKRKPEKLYRVKLADIKALKKIQKKIVEMNLPYLKIGGEPIYSTCTITKNENTNNIKYILEKYPFLEVCPLEIPKQIHYIKDEIGGIYLDYRNEFLDNFYIIKLRKKN